MKKIILLFLMLFVLPAVYADTCDPKPQIDDMGMSATTIALTSDPWSNIIAVEVNSGTNSLTFPMLIVMIPVPVKPSPSIL